MNIDEITKEIRILGSALRILDGRLGAVENELETIKKTVAIQESRTNKLENTVYK